MTKAKLNGTLHVFVQFLGQGLVTEIIPVHYQPVLHLIVGIAGALIAFLDTSAAIPSNSTASSTPSN